MLDYAITIVKIVKCGLVLMKQITTMKIIILVYLIILKMFAGRIKKMGIKNYHKVLYIKNLTNGNIEVIHDYFKYNEEIQAQILYQRLRNYVDIGQNFAIEYGLEVPKDF